MALSWPDLLWVNQAWPDNKWPSNSSINFDPLTTAAHHWPFSDAGSGVASLTDIIGGTTALFTRASTASTRLSNGVWNLAVASNTPRSYYESDGTYKGYLSEAAATQLLTSGSERDLTNGAWVATTCTVAKNQIGIDGVSNSASSLSATNTNATVLQTITAAATARTFSCFVKRISGTGTINIQQTGTTLDITALINSSTWTQVQLNANILNVVVGFQIATSGDSIAVDCTQFESAAQATTPIPTGGRAVDKMSSSVTNSINNGTWLVQWYAKDLSAAQTGMLLGTSDPGQNIQMLRLNPITTGVNCRDSSTTRTLLSGLSHVINTTYKTSISFGGAKVIAAESGNIGIAATFSGNFYNNPSPIWIGNRYDGNTPVTGCFKDIYNWTTALSDLYTASITGSLAAPTISGVGVTNVNEGTNMIFNVSLSNAYGLPYNFSYSISGTAIAGVNFTNSPTFSGGVTLAGGILTVPAGITNFTITYPTIHDGVITGNLTLNSNVSGVIAYGIIYDTDAIGDSLSTYVASSLVVSTTTTTDTYNVNDYNANGLSMVVPPVSGTFTKTIHKTGAANSKAYSVSRLGYVRLNGTNMVKIGNANLGLTHNHAIGILMRTDQANLTSYNGALQVLQTSQFGFGSTPYLVLGVGGDTYTPSSTRRNPFSQRTGMVASSNGVWTENSGLFQSYGTGTYADLFGSVSAAHGSNQWVWIWVYGRDPAASNQQEVNQSENGGNSWVANAMNMAHALHGKEANAGSISSRWGSSPLLNDSATSGINPSVLTNVDFVLGGTTSGTKIVDIARVIKLSTTPTLTQIGEMCSGWHPDALGLMSGDDFCIDFHGTTGPNSDALLTDIASPIYQPAEDGPIAHRYHGTDASDVTLSVTNQRIA